MSVRRGEFTTTVRVCQHCGKIRSPQPTLTLPDPCQCPASLGNTIPNDLEGGHGA